VDLVLANAVDRLLRTQQHIAVLLDVRKLAQL